MISESLLLEINFSCYTSTTGVPEFKSMAILCSCHVDAKDLDSGHFSQGVVGWENKRRPEEYLLEQTPNSLD